MNKIILDNGEYSFDASEKKVSVSAHKELFKKEYLFLITNVTTGDIIYNFGCEGYGGVIDRNVITLEYDTALMSDDDSLQIILYTEQTDSDVITTELLDTIRSNTSFQSEIFKELEKQTKLLRKIYNPE